MIESASKTTEQDSLYDNLETKSVQDLLIAMNAEDKKVPNAIEHALPQIEALISAVAKRMKQGGRLFYIGAGTSGRLGVVDASECPPTFGVAPDKIIGLMAGGDAAMRDAVEGAEDDKRLAWQDIGAYSPTPQDTVIGIAASGRTPYVVGGLTSAKENGLLTGCIVCNQDSAVANAADYPIEVIVGPEFITGSTRMKAGTAQKLVLNMISTAIMIQLGRVKGNKMVDMALSNEKLVDRGVRMIQEARHISYEDAKALLDKHGSIRSAIEA